MDLIRGLLEPLLTAPSVGAPKKRRYFTVFVSQFLSLNTQRSLVATCEPSVLKGD